MPSPSTPDLKAMQEQNRAALVEAIKRRNDLHVEVERLEQRVATLEREATEALRDGNRGTAKLRLQAKVAAEQELGARRGELASVEANVEDIKRSIRDTEELLRIQPPEAAKQQIVTVEGTSSAVPLTLRGTLDTLAAGDNGQPIATDTAADTMGANVPRMDNDFRPRSDGPAPDLSALSSTFLPPVPSEEPPPEADDLIAARAQERGLTVEAFSTMMMERLLEVSNMLLPANAPIAPDQDDAQSQLIDDIINGATIEMRELETASKNQHIRAVTQKSSLSRQVANVTRLRAEAEQNALEALNKEDRELARRMYGRMRLHEASLSVLNPLLAQAEEQLAQARRQIRQHEERIRQRVVKSMLLRAHLTAAALTFEQSLPTAETVLSDTADSDFDTWAHTHKQTQPE